MAVARVHDGTFSLSDIDEAWNGYYVVKEATKCTVDAGENSDRGLILTGSNFTYDSSGRLSSGTIKAITILNVDGSKEWSFSGLLINASEFVTAVNDYYAVRELQELFKTEQMTVYGSTLEDNFFGGKMDDKFYGSAGSDTFTGNAGRDTMSGGLGGFDILDYSKEVGGGAVNVDLKRGIATDTYGFRDTVSGMELVIGTAQDDTFLGSDTAAYEAFSGGLGSDVINGGGGTHNTIRYDYGYQYTYGVTVKLAGNADGTGFGRMNYSSETDTLIGIDDIVGGSSADILVGSASANVLAGLGGADEIDGGAGTDTIDYAIESGSSGVRVDLNKQFGYDSYGSRDSLTSIETVLGTDYRDRIAGSLNADTLFGRGGNDSLRGLAGADTLDGGDGNDLLIGGLGKDLLTGGAGYDRFVFDAKLDGTRNVDTIADFSVAEDLISLRNDVFTKLAIGDLASGALVLGARAKDRYSRILYNGETGALSYDADGTGSTAAIQFARLEPKLALTSQNFEVL